jgi:tetratricopeptide (TPR) repeat protein
MGERMTIGEMDPRCNGDTNEPPKLTPEQAAAHTWKPEEKAWETIKKRSTKASATMTITGFSDQKMKQPVSRGRVTFQTSKDPVGAPIFYRDVPLMPSELEKGVIKPLSAQAVRYITWRLKNIGQPGSRKLIESFPTCANCHSFSRDGKTLGMDVDGPQNDKGLYALVPVKPQTTIRKEDVIQWSSFKGKLGGRLRVGFMPQVSPDGQYVVTTINDPGAENRQHDGDVQGKYYVSNFKDYRFLQVFYPTRGILAWYSRGTGKLEPLPGADDPEYVQASAFWSPDGKYLVFVRAKARDPYPAGQKLAEYANDPNETQIQYDLYRIPFNDGKGGVPEPLAGASQNGMSNSFPKVSPDGRWMVYVQARNGLLMRPDSQLYIVPAQGGTARRMRCNTPLMNSWHSFSPNGRWLVFSSKGRSPYTQMYLTHIDEEGNDSPAILIENATAANRAVNIPEFVNIQQDGLMKIESPATEFYRLFDLALDLARKNQYSAAIPEWRKALELNPEDAKSHNNLGLALAKTGKLDEAIPQYQEALSLDPNFGDAHDNFALALTKKGKVDEAIPHFEKALELNPRDAKAHSNLGGILAEQGSLDKARSHFEKALEVDPDDADAHNNLAVALVKAGRMNEAIPHFEKALAADPSSVEVQYNLGIALAGTGRLDEAIPHFEKALELNPNDAKVHVNLGGVLAEKGRVDEAIAHFGKALAVEPHNAEAHNNLGIALARAGKLDEAIPHFEQALAGPAESLETHVNLGLALAQRGRIEEAIAHFRKSLAAPAASASLEDYIGGVLATQGRPDAAIPHFERALALGFADAAVTANAHYNLGSALYDARGAAVEALNQWREALRLAPDHLPALNRTARLLATHPDASLRKGLEAIQLAERAVELSAGRDAVFLDTLAAAYAEQQRFPEAVGTERRALALAAQGKNRSLVEVLSTRISLYEAHTPLRETR